MTAHPQSAPSQAAQQASSAMTDTKTTTPQPTKQVASPRRPRSRTAPSPNSVLDRRALVAALEKEGLYGTSVQPMHVVAFYQALHRQHYPDLSDFVTNYFQHEAATKDPSVRIVLQEDNRPLKNPISHKKNRNKMQLPKAFLQFLEQARTDRKFVTVTSTIAQQKTSADGSTTKLAIRLHDGQLVESVLMRYTRATASGSRASLCVSSQCGCAMGCTVSVACFVQSY